jgi:hypothetical protein
VRVLLSATDRCDMDFLNGFLFGIGAALGIIFVWVLIFLSVILIDKFKKE